MNNTKTTKRALLSSIMAMLICVTMLIGSTFAWFTDSVTSGKNTIVAGNLDIELEYSKDGNTWATVEEATELFADVTLWEPGTTSVVYLRIRNAGTLALKYQLSMNVADETVGTSVAGNEIRLSEHLKYGIVEGQNTKFADRAAARAAVTAPLTLATYNEAVQNLAADATRYFALVVYMPESVGNEANYRGDVVPTIDLGLNLVATQYTSESDSFGNDYDTNATYLNQDAEGNYLIGTADELVYFAKSVNTGTSYAGKTVKLTANIDLAGKKWVPVGNLVNYPTITFSGTFDGQGHTISNMNAVDNTVNHAVAGFFGSTAGATIQNVTFKDAVVKSTHYAGVVVAYEGSNSSLTNVNNVVVDGAAITSSAELINGAWDNGDKVGGIVGYATSIAVDDCDVKNSTITGYRDLGGIGGCLEGTYHSSVTNCSVDNVTITIDNTHNYKNFTSIAQHNVGDYIGRNINNATVTGNTGTANYVRGETAGTAEELKTLLAGYASNIGESITIDIAKDFDMANKWTTYNIGNYNGVNSLTINGNGHKITNLNAPLLMGAFAGSGVITINDLTISKANISQNGENLGIGAFIMHSDASGGVAFNNCKLENSVIECTGANVANGSAYAGGFIGYSSSDNTTFTNCSVIGCTISGQKSAGGLIGHAQTNLTVDGCTVTGNTISETLAGRTSPGAAAIVGRVSSTPIPTVKNTTVSGNTIKQGAAATSSATSVVCANSTYTGDNNTIQ